MVKKYVMDESKSWEQRYQDLERHHIEETTELYNKVQDLKMKVRDLEDRLNNHTDPDPPRNLFLDGE